MAGGRSACLLTEPGAARLGALTIPGARADAAVVDVGAGIIDVITPGAEVVAGNR
jgi:actin-like ATPase involved in cell morphogenesis